MEGELTPGNIEEIKPLLEAIQYQTNSLVVLSTGAMGFIVYTWLRIANVFGDTPTLAPFQRQWILAVPLLGFAICIASGHKSNTYVTGFLFENLQKKDALTKAAITNPEKYFMDSYVPIFE